jgi:hypothetical protein
MERDIIALMRENPLQGPFEGVGSENETFWSPENGNEQSKFHFDPK